MVAGGMRLWSAARHEREPQRVTVAGELAGAVRDAGDDPADQAVAATVLVHAGRGLGLRCPQPLVTRS